MLRNLLCVLLALGLSHASPRAGKPGRPRLGKPAPDFTLEWLGHDRKVNLKSLRGKVVMVDFWASWCFPCKRTFPELTRLRLRHPGLVILAVSLDENKAAALEFLKGKDTTLTALREENGEMQEKYGLRGIPSCMFIDRQGILRFRHEGYDEDEFDRMDAEIQSLLEDPP
jgi:cytochrome c biogenesis protein CcmG, thiol:disulfide interchange protein DsbE